MFEAMTQVSLTIFSSFSKSAFFTSSRSRTASITRSQSLSFARSSSVLPTFTSPAFRLWKNAAGRAFRALSSPPAENPFRAFPVALLFVAEIRRDDIEKEDLDACVGKVRGDAAPHDTRADDPCTPDRKTRALALSLKEWDKTLARLWGRDQGGAGGERRGGRIWRMAQAKTDGRA